MGDRRASARLVAMTMATLGLAAGGSYRRHHASLAPGARARRISPEAMGNLCRARSRFRMNISARTAQGIGTRGARLLFGSLLVLAVAARPVQAITITATGITGFPGADGSFFGDPGGPGGVGGAGAVLNSIPDLLNEAIATGGNGGKGSSGADGIGFIPGANGGGGRKG